MIQTEAMKAKARSLVYDISILSTVDDAAQKIAEALAATRAEAIEECVQVAFQKSGTVPHDSDYTRGYANGRSGAGVAIRALIGNGTA